MEHTLYHDNAMRNQNAGNVLFVMGGDHKVVEVVVELFGSNVNPFRRVHVGQKSVFKITREKVGGLISCMVSVTFFFQFSREDSHTCAWIWR